MRQRQRYQSAGERKAQIIDATVELVAEHGPDAVTVRQIAARAGVHHSLIFRHFGDRRALVREALLAEMAGWASAVTQSTSPADAFIGGLHHLAQRPSTASALAMNVVFDSGVEAGDQRFPIVDAYVELLVGAGLERQPARDLTVTLVALIAGWVAGRRFWLAAAHRQRSPRRAEQSVERHIRTLVEAALAA